MKRQREFEPRKMKVMMAILRVLVGALTCVALLNSAVLFIVPIFWPLSIVPVVYFAFCLIGVFVLLPKRHCWATALVLHGAAFVFLWFFCPPAERLLYFSGFITYTALWWLSVGYASVQLHPRGT